MESLLQNVPEEYKEIYTRHFNTIRTRVYRGKIKYVYHFLMTKNYSPKLVKEHLSVIWDEHKNGFKVNAAFGFILENRDTQELKFFHPSNNNTIFELPKLVINNRDYKELLDDLEKQDVMEYAHTQRPGTKWRVAKIVCMRFDVYKITRSGQTSSIKQK